MPFDIKKFYSSEEEKIMHERVKREIIFKKKVCNNSTYLCSSPCVDGYNYCRTHLSSDPKNPYGQCTYFYKNNKQCLNMALGTHTLCTEHTRKEQRKNRRSTFGQLSRAKTNENGSSRAKTNENVLLFEDEDNDKLDSALESSVEKITSSMKYLNNSNEKGTSSFQNNLIFNKEDVSTLKKSFEASLKLLKETYATQSKQERPKCNIDNIEELVTLTSKPKNSPNKIKTHEKFKAFKHGRRSRGSDALFEETRKEEERVTEGMKLQSVKTVKCIHVNKTKNCENAVIPETKYCREHILEKKKQILFKSCE
ncbi:KAT8 regulatory NSL complex subunit 2-like [Teleopsis dalmanni]|uniref:KAT8 regulatory NSL complex subunit 2-like n=1 Tax=Teleopsis dalmanni TaxID=139649 RepID=UPI0018CF604A|nr:KAT8 regulatory NSL complex subunit 2-like [Teleopsis dalmanni]